MITLTAKIELSGAEWTNAPTLISEPQTDTSNLFIIGESRLGEGAVFGSVSSGAKTEIVINQRNLISLESSIFDRSDIKIPSWGIISNGGKLEFNDPYGDVKVLAEQNLLTSNQKVEIYLNNTLAKKSEKVGDFYTSEWEYDTNNKTASVSLTDGLEELQNVVFEELYRIDMSKETYHNASYIYDLIKSRTPSKFVFPNVSDLDIQTQGVLNHTYVKSVVIYSGTLWSAWTKLCQLCQLYIYKNNNGDIVCKYNGGV